MKKSKTQSIGKDIAPDERLTKTVTLHTVNIENQMNKNSFFLRFFSKKKKENKPKVKEVRKIL